MLKKEDTHCGKCASCVRKKRGSVISARRADAEKISSFCASEAIWGNAFLAIKMELDQFLKIGFRNKRPRRTRTTSSAPLCAISLKNGFGGSSRNDQGQRKKKRRFTSEGKPKFANTQGDGGFQPLR